MRRRTAFDMADEPVLSIEQIFDAARARSGLERERFLDTACAGDTELRGELESLLVAHDSDPQFLVRPLARANAPRAAHIGRRLGPWELLEPIGAGGMGSVWRARRADGAYEQQVAIKLVRSGFAGPDDELVRRFLAERRTLAALEHPSIARLIDAGNAPDGTPWFAMELVEGEPIDRWCDEQRLSLRERVALCVRVARAVQFAHGKLVAHRDLKPANILVQRAPDGARGDAGLPKLLDFGIAKLLTAHADASALHTTDGPAPLTPAYASPEQFLGEPATTASDVYSLGVVLYRLVTGALPYELEGLAAHEVARRVCESAPRKPSELVAELPADLETILLAVLEKDPARRYAGAAAFADDLERFLSGHAIAARKASAFYRLRKLVRRNPVASALVAVVVLAVSGSAIWLAALSRRAFDAELLAETRRERAESASRDAGEQRDAALAARKDEATKRIEAEQALELVRRLYASPDPMHGDGRDVKVVDVLERGLRAIDEDASITPMAAQGLIRVAGQTYMNLGRLDDAQRCFERAVEILEQQGELDKRPGLRARQDVASLHQHFARWRDAATELEPVLARQRELFGDEDDDTLESIRSLANCYAELGLGEQAQLLIEEALDTHRRLGQTGTQAMMDLLLVLASARAEEGQPERAEELCLEVIDAFARRSPPDDVAIAHVGTLLARALWRGGRYSEAVARYRASEAALLGPFGPDHDYFFGLHQNLARVLLEMGAPDEARELLEDVVERETRLLGAQHPTTLIARDGLAQSVRQSRGDAAALPLLEGLIEACERELGPLDDLTLGVRAERLYALSDLGQAAEIELPLRDLIHDLKVKRHVSIELAAAVELTLGSTLERLHCFEESELWLKHTRDISAQHLGTQSRAHYGALNVLRRLYLHWGRDADARAIEAQVAALFGEATVRRMH